MKFFMDLSSCFGPGTKVRENVVIDDHVIIGDNCFIGANTVIRSGVRIGDNVVIGHNVVIEQNVIIQSCSTVQSQCHITTGVKIGSNVFFGPGVITTNDKRMVRYLEEEYFEQPPIFKNGCRIGGGASIAPGVTVGMNALIGTGSVVIKNVPDGAVVYGVPAKERK